jgi:uncharacterized repeat protein (TIGR01451 family)
VDPSNAIVELDEGNNEASQVLQVGQPSVANASITVQAQSTTTCQGKSLTANGSAYYDFATVPGTQDYAVQGGQVTVKLINSSSITVGTFTGATTDVNGNFSLGILAPLTDGVYTVLVKVSDNTVTGESQAATLTVSGPCTPTPTPPPAGNPGVPPPGGPPSPAQDVYVFSQDIYFSNLNPNVGEPINITAYIHYYGSAPVSGVPVTINDIFPVGGVLHTFQIGTAVVNFPSGGGGGPALVNIPWTNTAAGAHVIQVVASPGFAQYTGNDKATRELFVGPPATVAIDKTAALLVDADSNGTYSPGDTVRYTISYTNTGGFNVTGATIIDDFDETLLNAPFNISSGGVVSNGTINWSIGSIAAGSSGSVSYDVNIKPPAQFPEGTSIVKNTAELITDQTPPVADSVEIPVTNPPGGGSAVGGVVTLTTATTGGGSGGPLPLAFAVITLAAVAALGFTCSRRMR